MPTDWIDRNAVFAALDMGAVLETYDITPGRGTSFRINCPFHEDQRPSCSVDTEKKVFNCHACGEKGNALDFIAGVENLDPKSEFRAVLERAIDIIGENPTDQSKHPARSKRSASSNGSQEPKTKSANRKTAKSKPKGTAKKTDASSLEPNTPLEAPAFPLKLEADHPYLEERGFDADLIAEFGIGYETRASALMAGRICFPIHNAEGALVAYAGRWASDETDDDGNFIDSKDRVQERYKLPKGFRKGLELYNLHRVLADQTSDTVVIVEGYWSVLRLHSLGIPVVSSMGSSISAQQVELLNQYGFKQAILMFDGDEAGRNATPEALDTISKHLFVRGAFLPDGTKPDDVDGKFLFELMDLLAPMSEAKRKKAHSSEVCAASNAAHLPPDEPTFSMNASFTM